MLPNDPTLLRREQFFLAQANELHLDPRVRRTRQLLVQAFVEVSREKDFSSLTIQDITERATVNRATFYAHFEDKNALLDYYVRQSFGEKIKQRMDQGCGFTLPNLSTLIVTTCEYMAENHAGCRSADIHHLPHMRTQVQSQLYLLLQHWLESLPMQRTSQPVTPALMASTLSWTIFGAAIQWVMDEQKLPAEELARQVVELMTGGLAHLVDSPEVRSAKAERGFLVADSSE